MVKTRVFRLGYRFDDSVSKFVPVPYKPFFERVGIRYAWFRRKACLTQEEVSILSGVDVVDVLSLEMGLVMLGPRKYESVCKAVGITTKELFNYSWQYVGREC